MALLEWEADDGPVDLEVRWSLAPARGTAGSPETAPGATGASEAGVGSGAADLSFNRTSGGILVEGGPMGPLAAFAWSGSADALRVEGREVAARVRLDRGESVRLAVAVGASRAAVAKIRRALRAAGKPAVILRALSGGHQRLLESTLQLHAPGGASDRLHRALQRLLDHVVEVPGLGRSVVVGYRGESLRFRTPDSVAVGVAAASMGEREICRDVLRFLGRHADADGRIPFSVGADGRVDFDGAAGAWYLWLVAQYTAWTGDMATVRAEWDRVRRVVRSRDGWARREGPPAAAEQWAGALAGLVPAAEAVGDDSMAAELRGHEGSVEPWCGPAPVEASGGAADAAAVVRDVTHGLLGAEPDAPRGRLVLRPRAPEEWDRWVVRSLPIGEAAVDMEYTRRGQIHHLRVEQQRGGAPVQLVLAPELPGRLVGARVDGQEASLSREPAGDRVRVPVQLVLDAPRTLELEMAPGAD